jgi:L-aminopeptidase/D-esterase-like protein
MFALASGGSPLGTPPLRAAQIARIGSAAADCVSRAIARAVHNSR